MPCFESATSTNRDRLRRCSSVSKALTRDTLLTGYFDDQESLKISGKKRNTSGIDRRSHA
jgi:hypothetical protein